MHNTLLFGQGAENMSMRSYLASFFLRLKYLYLGLAARDESGLSEWPS